MHDVAVCVYVYYIHVNMIHNMRVSYYFFYDCRAKKKKVPGTPLSQIWDLDHVKPFMGFCTALICSII